METKEKTMKERWKSLQRKKEFRYLLILWSILLAAGQCLAVELSCSMSLDLGIAGILQTIQFRSFFYYGIEMCVVLLLDLLLLLILGRVSGALSLSAFITTALAVTNYFVYGLHGTPFTFRLMGNSGTALEVLFNYSFRMSKSLLLILIIGAIGVGISLLLGWKIRISRKKSLIPVCGFTMVLVLCFGIPGAPVPADAVSWSWESAISQFGYGNCLTQATIRGVRAVRKPRGYDEKKLKEFAENYEAEKRPGNQPDVILILNETFYDLQQVTDVMADQDYMSYIHSLSGAKTGYAVAPGVGGGTNRSEYEYLTGNSLQLSPNVTPFNAFNLENANSVVSMLKAQGYETQAIHSEPGENYRRNDGYRNLGFDTTHFAPDFTDTEFYGGRWYETDESVYRNMFRFYEEMGEGPRFFYTLTIQNHGGYDLLKPEDYLVHTGNDYGENTTQVHEFLTTISLSDQAFKSIVDYFSQSERDVIVCMVGDHAPSIVKSVADESLSGEERDLKARSVPYVIWSNHLELSREIPERISFNYLVPTVLDLAGISLAPYYDFLLSMRDQVPVLSSYGSYMTADGKIYDYNEKSQVSSQVDTYLGLVYANINNKPFMKEFTSVS